MTYFGRFSFEALKCCKRVSLLLISSFTLLSLNGCSSFSSKKPTVKLPAAAQKPAITRVWSVKLKGPLLTPTINGETLYTSTQTGQIQSLHLRTGKKEWAQSLNVALQGALSANAELLLATSTNGELIALDSVSGKTIWHEDIKRKVLGPIQFLEGHFVVWTEDGAVVLVDGRSHKTVWAKESDPNTILLRGPRTGTIALGAIFTGTPKGKLAVIDANSGQSFWEIDLTTAVRAAEADPLVDASGAAPLLTSAVACGSTGHSTVCVERLNGKVKWAQSYGTLTGLESDGLTFYGVTPSGTLFALKESTGELAWKYNYFEGHSFLKPEIMANSVLIAPLDQPLIIQINSETGAYQTAYTLPDKAQWMRALDDHSLIVQTQAGEVIRYELNENRPAKKIGK